MTDVPEAKPGERKRTIIWAVVGAIAILMAIIGGINACSKRPDSNANSKYEAIAQCEDRIKQLLKSPATAEFETDATGSGTWKVTGTVDSDNSFGASLRSSFQCTVVISGDSATTTVDYLTET